MALESTRVKLHYLPYVSFSSEFKYHAFIIYSRKDELWLTNKILPLLEERNELKCCIHYRDFEPGKDFHEAMADCVFKSPKVIAMISRNSFANNYCNSLQLQLYLPLNKRKIQNGRFPEIALASRGGKRQERIGLHYSLSNLDKV